jgi:N-acetylglutamate synthase-like GNAT family acetyltransferase
MRVGEYTEGKATAWVGMCSLVAEPLRPKLREVSSLVCDEAARGKGHATRLMERLTAIADDHKMTLLVTVEPFEDSPLDAARLAAWYARLGFKTIQQTPPVMARPPKQ